MLFGGNPAGEMGGAFPHDKAVHLPSPSAPGGAKKEQAEACSFIPYSVTWKVPAICPRRAPKPSAASAGYSQEMT